MIFIKCNQYVPSKEQDGLELQILGGKEFKTGLKTMKLDKCTDKEHVQWTKNSGVSRRTRSIGMKLRVTHKIQRAHRSHDETLRVNVRLDATMPFFKTIEQEKEKQKKGTYVF